MKYLVILGDGMADRPIEELVNKCEINHQRLRLFPKK